MKSEETGGRGEEALDGGKNILLKFCVQGKIWICAFKANLPDVTNSKKNSLWPKATWHALIFERKGEGEQFTGRKWLPGVSLLQCTT